MACVLIVEDDEDVRDFMDVLLRESGYDTMTAANGASGIEMMHHRKPCIDRRSRAGGDSCGLPDGDFRAAVVAERLKLRCLSKPVDGRFLGVSPPRS
jgi:CheY-like chemotaxis protein